MFHGLPWFGRKLRNFMLDHTNLPDKQISKAYTDEAQDLLKALLEADGVTVR